MHSRPALFTALPDGMPASAAVSLKSCFNILSRVVPKASASYYPTPTMASSLQIKDLLQILFGFPPKDHNVLEHSFCG